MTKGFSREYPKGRLSGNDEGQLVYGIAADHRNNRVIINYFKPIEWTGLDFDACMQLLTGLAKALSEVSGKIITVSVEDPSENE